MPKKTVQQLLRRDLEMLAVVTEALTSLSRGPVAVDPAFQYWIDRLRRTVNRYTERLRRSDENG